FTTNTHPMTSPGPNGAGNDLHRLSDDNDDSALLDSSEAAEVVPDDDNPDHPMDSDGDGDEDGDEDGAAQGEEIQLENNSIGHFDHHQDSIFCIAQHPLVPTTVATGSGDDTAFVFSTADVSRPLLPPSYESNPSSAGRASIPPIAKLTGHTDSVNAIAFTLPTGEYLLTGDLDGRLRAHSTVSASYPLVGENQEVPEINFILPCPHPSFPNTIGLGASDGSVWIYTVDARDKEAPLQVLQAYYLHTESCTAGAWTPDGKMLATVSEDGSLYVWDVFGEVSAAGITSSSQGQALVGLTAEDQRFTVEGGLFSVAVAPSGTVVAVGGAEGMIRIVGLPRLSVGTTESATKSQRGGGAKNKSGGSRKADAAAVEGSTGASAGQAGQILASLQVQSDSVESLAFSKRNSLLASGSVDGSIVVFDTAHRFSVRRNIKEAHEGFAVVQVEFVDVETSEGAWALTSCGLDGAVKRWDTRAGAAGAGTGSGQQGLVKEWRGHRGEGEGGGVLAFVQAGGLRIVTAGDDGVSLVFEAGEGLTS
ncbi:MAG: hypothetical protein Q9190_004161, partial [Brigantiaea leucoxantha]